MKRLRKIIFPILSFIIMISLISTLTTKKVSASEFEYAIKPQFKDLGDWGSSWGKFSEGLKLVKIDGKYGFIDKTGKIIIKPQFEYAYDFSEGFGRIVAKGKYGFIDKTGKIIIKPQFDDAWNFSDGLAKVKLGNN